MSVKKKSIIGIAFAVVIVAIIVIFGSNKISGVKTYTVREKNFELALNSKGEIQGKNAILITLPDELMSRDIRIYEVQLKNIVDEGTLVKKGDWVATLDAAAINQQIQSNMDNLVKRKAELNDAKIDSAIELTKLREEIEEFKYDLEYKKVELEQAKFESPAFQRKTQVDFNKTLRQMEKKRRDYELRKLNLKMRVRRTEDTYMEYYIRDSLLKEAVKATRVTAPQDGMVMYAKLWGGRKLKVGDNISRWNSTIATLPDMSEPVSETYVKEIDINKIKPGDSVAVEIDAMPDVIFSGQIEKIANIGQELPGYDTKVFKVIIKLETNGVELKPSMTTNNNIIISNLKNVICIPREALFYHNGQSFVFIKTSGEIQKKLVKTGLENETEVVINEGLFVKDKVLLSAPEEMANIEFAAVQ